MKHDLFDSLNRSVIRYDRVNQAAPVSTTTGNRSYQTAWQPKVARMPASASLFIIASLCEIGAKISCKILC
jgi:limonene-1,2-epoxide hydrolase